MDILLTKPIVPIVDAGPAESDLTRSIDQAAALLARRMCAAYPDGGQLLAQAIQAAIQERGVEGVRADIAASAERCRDVRRREAEVLRAYGERDRRR